MRYHNVKLKWLLLDHSLNNLYHCNQRFEWTAYRSTIDTLTKDIKTKEAEVAEMQVQIKRASEDREMENKEFQQTVAWARNEN